MPHESWGDLRTPCYIVRHEVVRRNAAAMLNRAESLGCTLRPHVKTHKTVEAALLQTGGRKERIVVSTLAEAEFFCNAGFTDILYAVPISPDKIPTAASLLQRCKFHVVVDNEQQLKPLLATVPGDGNQWSIFLMVDCGYHRDGIEPSNPVAVEMAKSIMDCPHATFAGCYTHGGNSYDALGVSEIERYAKAERDAVVEMAEVLKRHGITSPTVGVGSTPTCSHPPPDGLEGVTEMHPGNYIFYDAMQARIGSCKVEDIAVRVLTRVIGSYPATGKLLVDMGWTGCSVQGSEHGYGLITSHPELTIKTLKQEAGEVGTKDGSPLDFAKYPVGTILEVAPWHSCASSALHSKFLVLRDDDSVEGEWVPCRGW